MSREMFACNHKHWKSLTASSYVPPTRGSSLTSVLATCSACVESESPLVAQIMSTGAWPRDTENSASPAPIIARVNHQARRHNTHIIFVAYMVTS